MPITSEGVSLTKTKEVNMTMEHDWEPGGIYQNKYVEAGCTKCKRRECSGADFCDSDKIKMFWKKIEKLHDCKGKRH